MESTISKPQRKVAQEVQTEAAEPKKVNKIVVLNTQSDIQKAFDRQQQKPDEDVNYVVPFEAFKEINNIAMQLRAKAEEFAGQVKELQTGAFFKRIEYILQILQLPSIPTALYEKYLNELDRLMTVEEDSSTTPESDIEASRTESE